MDIQEVSGYEGREVILKGWVYNKRSSGGISFLLVRDGTGFLQVVFIEKETDPETFKLSERVSQESSVEVRGVVRREKRAPGGYELRGKGLRVISPAQDYPITPKSHGIDFLMKHRHLWLRSKRPFATLRIRDEVMRACRDFMALKGFTLIDAPIFTPTACEGTTTLFNVNYFHTKAYLSQSGQLYMEPAAAAFGKVYCLGPTFRAEKSKTRRHLIEFWQIEPEAAFMDMDGAIRLAEELISFIIERVLKNRYKELEILERDTKRLEGVSPPFPKITYKEAIEILNREGNPIKYGEDFGGDEETILSSQFDKPLVIHHYPREIKPFYMKEDPSNPSLVLNFDILAPEGYGEIVGGSQREDDIERLEKRIEEENLPKESLEWYLDVRRYGSFPHSGFGLGIERTIAWICRLSHVREAIPYPRLLDRVYP